MAELDKDNPNTSDEMTLLQEMRKEFMEQIKNLHIELKISVESFNENIAELIETTKSTTSYQKPQEPLYYDYL